ncbi:hypothetical protein [Flavicella marina]|uniref:hypothetical protein n=1 Tax=Flavicella marina TaxID=1475951 RepID=UPI00126426AC|nr:hypothetical protein [Flavicella marina]
MKKIVFFIIAITLSFISSAQNNPLYLKDLKGYELENTIKLNYIPVDIQKSPLGIEEIPMGVIGVHYDFPFNKNFYGGIGMFAAVEGDQGGLFTLGVELGFQQKLYKNFYFDTDFHFGGGGGYRYLVKDGAFINYNIGLKYRTKKIAFGAQYSYFNFYNGYIESGNVSGFVSIPTSFLFTDYSEANQHYTISNDTPYFWNRKASKNALTLRFDQFYTTGNTKDQYYNPIENTLHLIGFEYDHYINRKTFGYIHLDAIYKGLESGFMDLFMGVGYEPIQTSTFKLFAKFGAGASGGRVEREGGFTIYPSVGLEQKIYENLAIALHGGYIMAPFGNFEAYTAGFGFKYRTFDNGSYHPEKETYIAKTKGIRLGIQNQTYFQAASTETKPYDLQLITAQLNSDISNHFYLTGQATFAYEGEAGGYADGMVGIGYNSPMFFYKKLEFIAEFLGGASGGAKIDTGAGLAIKPKIGLNYSLNHKLHITSGFGKIIAPYGNLNSTLLSFGFTFNFSKIQL